MNERGDSAVKTTTELVIDNYNTNLHRTEAVDPFFQRKLFQAYSRSLRGNLPDRERDHILDVGCGEGSFMSFLTASGFEHVEGFDASPENVMLCQKRGLRSVRHHDALAIQNYPKPDGGWDWVYCLDLVEHLPKEGIGAFLANVRSVLAPGGSVIVQVPNMAYVCASFMRYDDVTHEVGFTENSLRTVLKVAGFSEIFIGPAWGATTLRGRCREGYLKMLHRAVYLAEGKRRPRVASKNLVARAIHQPTTATLDTAETPGARGA